MLGRAVRGRAAVPRLCALARSKQTTGIVGLEVVASPQPVLEELYTKTLAALESIPADAEYRKTVETLTRSRLEAVRSAADVGALEAAIGAGQAEQLIASARDELALIPRLVAADAFSTYDGATTADEIYADLKRRGIALQRADIPMRPSTNFPPENEVELQLPPVEEKEK